MIGSCWEYAAYRRKDGYKMWKKLVDGKRKTAHVVVYEKLVGKIKPGMVIDHLCRNRGCVNPDHMEVVTQKENILRGLGVASINHKKTTCKNGHSLSGDNLYSYKGRRHCRECRHIWDNQHPRRWVNGRRIYA